MGALYRQALVVPERVGGHLPLLRHLARRRDWFASLQVEIGPDHRDAGLDQPSDRRAELSARVAQAGFTGRIEPDDGFAPGVDRMQPFDRHLLATCVAQCPLDLEMRGTPLGLPIAKPRSSGCRRISNLLISARGIFSPSAVRRMHSSKEGRSHSGVPLCRIAPSTAGASLNAPIARTASRPPNIMDALTVVNLRPCFTTCVKISKSPGGSGAR